MKKLLTSLVAAPGAAFAHGAHAPVPEAAHGMAHAGLTVGLLVIGVALAVVIVQRWRT